MEALIKALKQIEQFSDVGDDFLAVCKMKSIATDALKAHTAPTQSEIEAEAESSEALFNGTDLRRCYGEMCDKVLREERCPLTGHELIEYLLAAKK